MEEQNKIQILLATAEERNKAIHIMRERVQKTCIGVMGIFYIMAGWFIKDGIALTSIQKWFLNSRDFGCRSSHALSISEGYLSRFPRSAACFSTH